MRSSSLVLVIALVGWGTARNSLSASPRAGIHARDRRDLIRFLDDRADHSELRNRFGPHEPVVKPPWARVPRPIDHTAPAGLRQPGGPRRREVRARMGVEGISRWRVGDTTRRMETRDAGRCGEGPPRRTAGAAGRGGRGRGDRERAGRAGSAVTGDSLEGRLADIWGVRTPYMPRDEWPVRVDQLLEIRRAVRTTLRGKTLFGQAMSALDVTRDSVASSISEVSTCCRIGGRKAADGSLTYLQREVQESSPNRRELPHVVDPGQIVSAPVSAVSINSSNRGGRDARQATVG
jgi:hypothetical protein